MSVHRNIIPNYTQQVAPFLDSVIRFDIRMSVHRNIIPNYTQQVATFLDSVIRFDIRMSVHRNIIPNYTQQVATFLDLFISTATLHVSGGSSAHHQEHITVNTTSGIFNQYCC